MSKAKQKTGIFKMTDEKYFASPGLSQSFLKQFIVSPFHALNQKPKVSKGLSKGTMIHNYLLDPKEFKKSYEVETEKKLEEIKAEYGKESKNIRLTKVYKDYVAGVQESGKSLINTTEMSELKQIKKNFMEFAENYEYDGYNFLELFEKSKKEYAIFGEAAGYLFRGKLDCFFIDDFAEKIYIFDLKTIGDWSKAERQVTEYKYYWQESVYKMLFSLNGYENYEKHFVDIFIESVYPYFIFTVINGIDLISWGQREIQEAIQMWRDYQDGTLKIKPYTTDTLNVNKPRWWEYEDLNDDKKKHIDLSGKPNEKS